MHVLASVAADGQVLSRKGQVLSETEITGRGTGRGRSISDSVQEVSPRQAFEAVTADPQALLVDVRSAAEWCFVGLPAVAGLITVEWQSFPAQSQNPDFLKQVAAAIRDRGGDQSARLYMICRSGARSRAAAMALNAAGFHAVNVAEGFEGDLDPSSGRRGLFNGWKYASLPWRQS